MKEVLKDIQSGKFAKQWMDECKGGQKNFLKMREELAKHPIEKVGKKLRDLCHGLVRINSSINLRIKPIWLKKLIFF